MALWRRIMALPVVSLLVAFIVTLTGATNCTFENKTVCDWMIRGGWRLSQAMALSDYAIDRTYLSSNGHILAFDYQSYGASYASPFIYFPSSSCALSFYYRPPVDIAASFGVSLVSSNGKSSTVWNVTWPGSFNRTECNSTWLWHLVSINVPQFVHPFQVVFEAQSNISNNSTTNGCAVLAIDDIKVTGCDPVDPQISTSMPLMVVKEGNQFNLSVVVTGVPYPTVSWLRNNVPLVSDGRVTVHTGGEVVQVEHANLHDTGVFLANASSGDQWVSQTVEVTVYVPPFTHDKPGNHTITQGSNLTLDCPVEGHPKLTFVWFYGDDVVPLSNQTRSRLHLYNVQFIQQGNYSCAALNLFGQAAWWSLVYVQVPPVIVNTSFGMQVLVPVDGVVLSCTAAGQPSPVMSWDIVSGVSPIILMIGQTYDGYSVLKDGSLEVQSSSTLIKSTVKCVAQNGAGYDQSQTTTVLIQVNGMWSAWVDWSECSVTCGSQQQRRTRTCSNPQPQNGGSVCMGNATQARECPLRVPCPIDGGWSTWSSWNQCSKSCGLAGMRTRERTCCCPKPQYGGKECIGNTAQSKDCFPTECPPAWGEWGEWADCSETCGYNSYRYRERSCFNLVDGTKAANCSNGNSTAFDSEICFSKECPSFQKFVAMPEDQTVVVGGVAKFDCRYEPEDLLMKWFKGSILIKYAVRPERVRIGNGSLMILEVEKSDSETYTCQVADRRATASLTVKLSSDTSDGSKSKSSSSGITLPAVGLMIVIGIVAILMVLVAIIFVRRKRSTFNFFKTSHPPIEIQGAQLMQSQPRGSTSTEITIVPSPTAKENYYVSGPIAKEDSVFQEAVDAERPVSPSSPTTNRNSSVSVFDNHEEELPHERKQRPRTLSIDGFRNPMKLKSSLSSCPRSAPATPLDHRSELEEIHKNSLNDQRLPGNFRISGKSRTLTSPVGVSRRHSANIVDSDIVVSPSLTLPRVKARPSNSLALGGNQWTMPNPPIAQSSDRSNDHTPIAESIPMKDMTRQRASVPYDFAAANGFYTGQTNYPERHRPSGSSTAGYHNQPPANRGPPKRSQSYDSHYLIDNQSSPGPQSSFVDVNPALERVQSPRSQDSDDVFDTDTGQKSEANALSRYFSVPANHDNYQSSVHDRRRSETNL